MSFLESSIHKIQSASTQEEAFEHFNYALGQLGYTRNVYTLMNDHHSIGQKAYHGLASTFPEDWLSYYNRNKYQEIDGVWHRLLASNTPFFWKNCIEDLMRNPKLPEKKIKGMKKVMNLAEDAGVADGIGISFISPLGEISGFGLSRNKAEKDHSYEELGQIYLLAAVFNEKFLSYYNHHSPPQLSQRQLEILSWAAENKSDSDIADIMGISIPTVRHHWKIIFKKLGTNGRVLAVTKAMHARLISPQFIRPCTKKIIASLCLSILSFDFLGLSDSIVFL